jgi:hypothetical protein
MAIVTMRQEYLDMSISRPFFNTSNKRSMPLFTPVVSEEEYKQLHWSKQLELRPLRDQYRRQWPTGDFDIYIDMYDTEEPKDETTSSIT